MPPSLHLLLLPLLLLGLMGSAASLPPPRSSFLLDSEDRPLVFFNLPNVHNTTTLLLSDDGSTLYVGAQDAVLSLDVSQSNVISLKKKMEWSPSVRDINECQNKGKNPAVDCPNFVHVLQPINSTHLYACGSFAYSPRDIYIDIQTFTMVQHGSGKGRCPFSPFQSSTALAIDGELFTATTTNFRGDTPQISRHFSKDGRPDVSQDSSVSLLEEPTFVSSSFDPSDRKLYFFFTEVGKEFSFVDELQIARVAQVCKDDVGGQRTLQKKWTSFAKAPLLCQASKQLHFNVLQDIFTLHPVHGSDTSDTLFYGVFTSQWSSTAGSAVCVFRLQDVKTVFAQNYKTFNVQTHQFSQTLGKHSHVGKCGLDSATDSELDQVKKTFLTNNGVKPAGVGPIFMSSTERYSGVAVMRTAAVDGKQHTVLLLLTESGLLHRVALSDQGPRLIEEIQVFTQPQAVKSIILSPSKGVLYMGTSEGVTAVPVARCSIYKSCSQCILARDPLCGWSRTKRLCTHLDGSDANMAQDLQDANVEKECQGQSTIGVDIEVIAELNQVVSLPCLKPSNLATLTWTSSRDLTQKLFIHSTDGTLSFIATANTFGTYHCEAEEGNYKEVVQSYVVRSTITPRAMSPRVYSFTEGTHKDEDEAFEDVAAEEPSALTQPSGEVEEQTEEFTTSPKEEPNTEDTVLKNTFRSLGFSPTATNDTQFMEEHHNSPQKTKIYRSELVVVSFLLAACVCALILIGIHKWYKTSDGGPDDSSKTDQSMESVPSLSRQEESEVKVAP